MKYRIKIVTYKSGRIDYTPQVKKWFWWRGLTHTGEAMAMNFPQETRQRALDRIDKHFNGNTEIQFIEFEHIKK